MRLPKTTLFFLTIFLLTQAQGWAGMREEKKDKNGDGKMDQWFQYNSKGKLVQKATDTNADGKPDQFQTFPGGSRDLAIKEYDRNFDGKIDKRAWTQWDPSKTLPSVSNGRITHIPNPGYTTLKKEEDNNFDGVIDVDYRKKEKGQKSPVVNSRVGEPIDQALHSTDESDGASQTQSQGGSDIPKTKVDRLNEQYGYETEKKLSY